MKKTKQPMRTCALLSVALTAIAVLPTAVAAGDIADPAELGRDLFVRRFMAGEIQPEGGDGLGPLFNHSSCAACHRQAALGGGGGIELNVTLLSAQLANPGNRPPQKTLLTALKALHPAFVGEDGKIVPSILLHRFGPGERYFQLKAELGGAEVPLDPDAIERDELQRQLGREPLPATNTKTPLRLVRSQRNTTALFGAGLIDEIPDTVLHTLAAAQARQGEVTGRVPPIGPDKVGRFGWRGQQEHLHDFVLGACANELGLEVPGNQQPMNPLRPRYRPAGLDLTADQCELLTKYVASLPPPKIVEPTTTEQREIVASGRRLFSSVGCAACHIERIGPVEGIYSDLLLHDLGPGLTDPVLAAATLVFLKQHPPKDDLLTSSSVATSIPRAPLPETPPQPSPPNHYYGGSPFQSLALAGAPPATVKITDPKTRMVNEFSVQQTTLDREWRTPPLWGLADSAPYLHDGRAATVVEAVALHGGEADACTKRFFTLPAGERLAVLEFLKCLRAP
jgi:CxxC motif-containing protein (DUF1111 family)